VFELNVPENNALRIFETLINLYQATDYNMLET